MKILIDGRLYGPENTGNGRYTMNMVSELSKLDKSNSYILLLRKKHFDNLALPDNWLKVLADFKHYSFEEQIKLPFLILKYKPDLVHFPHLNVPILYFGKYIVTIHDMIMHKFKGGEATTRPFPLYQIWRLGYYLSFLKAVMGSARIIVPSGAVKKEIQDYYKIDSGKIVPIYEGFDTGISSHNGKPLDIKTPYFVYVGNAYPHKNLKRLIDAVKLLNSTRSEPVYLAISSAKTIFAERLINMVEKLGMTKYVKILGFVSDNDLAMLYKNSTAFVFPTLAEGFGLTGLEAISCGTLLVASDIPVLREIYANNAIYFDPLETSSIEKAMKGALEMNAIDRNKYIEEGQKFAKRYSWAKMAEETLKIYDTFKNKSSHNIR